MYYIFHLCPWRANVIALDENKRIFWRIHIDLSANHDFWEKNLSRRPNEADGYKTSTVHGPFWLCDNAGQRLSLTQFIRIVACNGIGSRLQLFINYWSFFHLERALILLLLFFILQNYKDEIAGGDSFVN